MRHNLNLLQFITHHIAADDDDDVCSAIAIPPQIKKADWILSHGDRKWYLNSENSCCFFVL